ncbi:CRISPR-associated endonuclease Cas1 [Methylocella sp.]|jgi:CRISPR-associated endonuclease Cas1|uniref:CRISPR-associated endonuclease Cas1 n=1 Tax=Methylocella sp. TaxID=1978226 RepID=UPI003C1C0EC7
MKPISQNVNNHPASRSVPLIVKSASPWATRCEMWRGRVEKASARSSKRAKPAPALVLAGHGVSLKIQGGALAINNGLTHYPQKREQYLFFRADPDLRERIILLDGSGSISFDVLSWLAEQGVSLVRIDWRGNTVCVASKSGYSANPYRVQWQRELRENENLRLEFSIGKIAEKIENSIITLEKSIRRNDAWNKAMEAAYSTLTKFDAKQPKTISELRVLEANAAAAYFRAWKGIPIKWRGISKRPIPENWKEIGQRTSIFLRAGNRNASHPVNALLNYAYTVLQSELQIQAIAEGYDPTIGIMHEAHDGSPAFVFDLMEPRRATVDRKILGFIKGYVFDPADFTIRMDGVCRINPELARMVATASTRRI